ncbi:MAG: GH25 family lysozyme [Bacteroidia bacterium]|nr:GH25 family lysozyme [Bacteroidia bacterium]
MPQKAPVKRKPVTRKKSRKRKKKVSVGAPAAFIIAALLIVLCIWIPLHRNAGGTDSGTGDKLPDISFSACGIDISHNNAGPVVWDSLMVLVDRGGRMTLDKRKASRVYPVRFVFIKASEGISMKDPMFKKNWEDAAGHDIQRGAYHFFRSSKDGESQARNFISAVGDLRHSDLPPVLDIETIHLGCSARTLNSRALQWLKAIEKHYGRKPIVYTYESFAKDVLSSEITDNYPVWIAHYGVENPDFQGWEFWQFTDKALVYGLPEPVDLNFRR